MKTEAGKGSRNIVRSGVAVSLIILISKLLGFVKQSVVAWNFGASNETDIYYVAEGFVTSLPTVIFSSISVMLLTQYVYEHNKNKKETLVSNMYVVYFAIALILVILLMAFASQITSIIAPGYSYGKRLEVAKYIRYLAIILLMYCIMSIGGTVLDGEKHFIPSKLQSVCLSLSVIISIIMFGKKIGIKAVPLGVVLGYFSHSILVLICSRKYVKFHVSNPFRDQRVRFVIRQSLPLLAGNAIVDLLGIIDKTIASELGEGSVSTLYYAQVVSNNVISGVFVSTIGSILLPYFTEYVANEKLDNFRITIEKSLGCISIILAYFTVLYAFSASEIVKLVFQHGKFASEDSSETAYAVVGYSLGFIPMAVREIYVKAHYAFQDTKSTTINGLLGAVLNTLISIVLAQKYGIIGISIGTSTSYLIIALLSIITIRKHIRGINYKGVCLTIIKTIVASAASAFTIVVMRLMLHNENILTWLISCLLSFCTYLCVLKLIKCDEIKIIMRLLKTNRGKNNET